MNYFVFARVLAIATLYLESGDESILDPDTAVQGLEDLATVLQDLKPEEVTALDEALRHVALEYDGEGREVVSKIVRNYGLVDDPDVSVVSRPPCGSAGGQDACRL